MSLYAPEPRTPIVTAAALVASKIVSTTSGVHYQTTAQIDSTAPTAVYYLHMIQGNAGAAVPGNGAYSAGLTFLHAPIAWSHTSGAADVFTIDDGDGGAKFTAGLFVALSTTQFTLTAATYLLTDSVIA